jgi:hypothetical protein
VLLPTVMAMVSSTVIIRRMAFIIPIMSHHKHSQRFIALVVGVNADKARCGT